MLNKRKDVFASFGVPQAGHESRLCIEIVGEAATNVTEATRRRPPEVRRRGIVAPNRRIPIRMRPCARARRRSGRYAAQPPRSLHLDKLGAGRSRLTV